MSEQTKNKARTLVGTVLRKSGDKTIAVETSRVVLHKLYQKRRTVTKRYLVHDADNVGQIGDIVTIQESRPLSARKRWVLLIDKEAKGTARKAKV